MAGLRLVAAPYIYVCTRMRVRKTTLLPKEEYMRMLNMNLPEITRFIGETDYKQEIDELSSTFKGIDLIEVALSWNLAKEYQKIQEITPGSLKQFTQAYLRRWDIQNVLTILKGKMQGAKTGKIKEILVPAGSLDKVVLDRLLAEDSLDKIVETLKGYRMYPQVFIRQRKVVPFHGWKMSSINSSTQRSSLKQRVESKGENFSLISSGSKLISRMSRPCSGCVRTLLRKMPGPCISREARCQQLILSP
jgi:hypothetical protein